MHLEVNPISFDKLTGDMIGESSESIKIEVDKSRKIQLDRYKKIGIYNNAQLNPKNMKIYCKLTDTQKSMIKEAFYTCL